MFDAPDIQYYTPEEALAKKKAFAVALMRDPTNPARAAAAVEPRSSHAGYMLTHWQYDTEVQAFMQAEIDEKGLAKAKLPTKDEFAASLIEEANSCRDKEIKLDFLKLFASVMGYVEKPAAVSLTTNNTVNNVKNNVLVLPTRKPPEEIEARIMESQRILTAKK